MLHRRPSLPTCRKPWRAQPQLREKRRKRHPQPRFIENKDLKDPGDPTPAVAEPGAATQGSATQNKSAAADPQVQKDRAFEAQGQIFKKQVLAEKTKIAAIQSRLANLKYQFDQWSLSFSQDVSDAQECWTSTYYTPYYRDWCDTGRKLKAQADATQRQLDQEKTRLKQMQENIRRQGYGNGVYDAD